MTATKIQAYIHQFDNVFEGEPWFGESITTKLKDLTEAQVMQAPREDVHSIAELVSHIVYWRQTLIRRLQGESDYTSTTESQDNWPSLETLKAKGWNAIKADLDRSQRWLTEGLSSKTDSFLEKEYTQGCSFGQLVQGILEHDVYHLGQIGLVKKMIT